MECSILQSDDKLQTELSKHSPQSRKKFESKGSAKFVESLLEQVEHESSRKSDAKRSDAGKNGGNAAVKVDERAKSKSASRERDVTLSRNINHLRNSGDRFKKNLKFPQEFNIFSEISPNGKITCKFSIFLRNN